ncbi:hypothetical protein GF345_02725 [Candidatus Woesearchaeota archaeon]|nr:hypothetical protein [Candidatus Woesearchaeota archaeon]
MQLALNLLSEEKIKNLIKEMEDKSDSDTDIDTDLDENDEEDNESICPDAVEIPGIEDKDNELELMIRELEKKEAKKTKDKEDPEISRSKDTIKDIIRKIDKKFRKKAKKDKGLARKSSEYLKEEFFNKNQYGIDISELFSYMNTKAQTDVYRKFYNSAKEKVYVFDEDMLSKEQQEKIVRTTKMARWMGYTGDTTYCSHEMTDAPTREKWELIRNICFVHTLTMLRYDLSYS